MHISNFSFADRVWNPVVGCSKVSEGCDNCYAVTIIKKMKSRGMEQYKNGFDTVTAIESRLHDPLRAKQPRTILVNDLSDHFHEEIDVDFLKKVHLVMNTASQHRFLIMTKRIGRGVQIQNELSWSPNIWIGVSVEGPQYLERIELLKQMRVDFKFVVLAPLIDEISLPDLSGINWIIVNGEMAGVQRRRQTYKKWVRTILQEARRQKVPVWFEGWGPKNAAAEIDGKIVRELPLI